jgi:hypothetical protein
MASHSQQFALSNSSVSFSYKEFSPSDEDSLILQGDAKILDDGVLALPGDPSSSDSTISRVLFASPVPIWNSSTGAVADFETCFTFSVTDVKNYTPADGFVFFLAPWKARADVPVNSGGGMLGIVNGSNAFNNFVAVEFDTYTNEWDPKYTDHTASHFGIDVSSLISLQTKKWDRVSHQVEKVNITYHSSSKTLTVQLTPPNAPASSISQVIDLKAVLPETVSVGFSATTTSGFRENHFINSWSFTSNV